MVEGGGDGFVFLEALDEVVIVKTLGLKMEVEVRRFLGIVSLILGNYYEACVVFTSA